MAFCLVGDFLEATWRQYAFMLGGLREVEKDLRRLSIGFFLVRGEPVSLMPRLLKDLDASALVADFDPLRIKRAWVDGVAGKLRIPFFRVDAHNIVPCRFASPKREFGAYTLRLKLRRLLPEFLTGFPRVKRHPFRSEEAGAEAGGVDWDSLEERLAGWTAR